MGREDWKYDDEIWDSREDEETKAPPPERQCPRCTRWVPREAAFCMWCGKPLEDAARK